MDWPLGYHITWGTYGTRLHGDPRGTVDRLHNQQGDPIIARNEDWERMERHRLRFAPVILTHEQRMFIERQVPAICGRGGWTFHNTAAREDHVHVEITASANGKAMRRWLKTWLGQALSEIWPLPPGATWWAECGSVKPAWSMWYFENVYHYIEGQRTTPK